MEHEISRRYLIRAALMAGAVVPVLAIVGKQARAAELTPLDPNDPTAKALMFVVDASKVDAKASPTFKPGQQCAGCAQYQGKPGDKSGGCTIFAGHSVPAGGWCSAFVKRQG